MSEAVWYWREGSTQHGPITWEKLRSLAECGKISPSDWVMREGWEDWKLACEANDSGVDAAAVGRPPEPPPLLPPLPPPVHPVSSGPPPAATMMPPFVSPVGQGAPPPAGQEGPGLQAPITMMPVPEMVSAALPMPLPPLAPGQTLVDVGPPAPSPDGVSEGEVVELRRALRDGPDGQQAAGEWNVPAMAALAASLLGLLALALEMGLVGLGLGGWCLYAASAGGNNNGKGLALAAVVIGAFNVAFRVLGATVDLGLTM